MFALKLPMKVRWNLLRIKMLRKNDAGEIKEFHVNSWEEKQLFDTQRKKYRQLDYEVPDANRKQALRQRQKAARELRVIATQIKSL